MQKLINLLEVKYDFILIACPAGIDEGFKNAIETVNEALLIVTPEVTSIRDADKVVGILETRDMDEIKLVINRVKPKMIKSETMMSIDDVQGILGIPIIGIIPDSEQVIIASNRGEPLVLDKGDSLPKQAFEDIARRLIGEEVEFIDFEAARNPVKRLFKNIVRSKAPKPKIRKRESQD
jgi:septum site-determining protein MinD